MIKGHKTNRIQSLRNFPSIPGIQDIKEQRENSNVHSCQRPGYQISRQRIGFFGGYLIRQASVLIFPHPAQIGNHLFSRTPAALFQAFTDSDSCIKTRFPAQLFQKQLRRTLGFRMQAVCCRRSPTGIGILQFLCQFFCRQARTGCNFFFGSLSPASQFGLCTFHSAPPSISFYSILQI